MKNIFLFIFTIFALCSYDNGDLAPNSVEGKTITISFEGAEYRNNDGDTSINIESVKWEKVLYQSDMIFHFNQKTKSIRRYFSNVECFNNGTISVITADYIKISNNTVRIEVNDNNNADGYYYTFILTFLSPNYGTVIWEKYYGDYNIEGKNAVFYIE